MKPVAYGGEPPHFIFSLMLTLTYAFELKRGPKCQYMLKELDTQHTHLHAHTDTHFLLFTPTARSFEGEPLIGFKIKSMPILSVLFNREL